MKVLIIGSGGREDALAWKISQSPKLTKLYAVPGNSGMSRHAECHSFPLTDFDQLIDFARKEAIDLTVVGPEAPLVQGITDAFQAAGLKVFGPSQAAAKLEGSKAFSKQQMMKFGIPTAAFEVFTNVKEAKHYVIETEMPVVIKADGLAAGKGVILCDSSAEAVRAIDDIMERKVFGEAGSKVVIEQKLEGEELSVLALSDGKTIIPLASSQDHKRVFDHDQGPNTGGMGAYSPCPLVSDEKFEEIIEKTIRPMVDGMAQEGIPYRGVLYAGIMLTKDGPYVLEYNCRFGDPETQVILPRMKSDLLPVLLEIAEGKLSVDHLDWHEKVCLGVVMASDGYPGHYQKGFPIQGLETVASESDVFVFHAGTARGPKGEFVTDGGRVLLLAALGDTLRSAYERAYASIKAIHFQGGFYRKDIGRKALEVFKH